MDKLGKILKKCVSNAAKGWQTTAAGVALAVFGAYLAFGPAKQTEAGLTAVGLGLGAVFGFSDQGGAEGAEKAKA